MKKILSLLVLLVTTLSAFALDFTDYRKVTLGSYTPTESNDAKLSVTDNGDGTYNVTFNDIINKDGSYTDNYGTFTFSNVSGSKSGDVTTVTATDVTGTVSGGTYNITEFTKGNLSLKFKDGKAYATMTATCRVFYSNNTFDVVFGTDEGFDGGSTGGGETGGETSSIVTVKENFQSTEGSSWGENVTIDWNTQKLVVSVNLASTGSDKGFLGVTKKGQTAGWNNYGIIFYNTNGSTVQGYAPGQPNNANTNQVTKGEDPVRFEISKDGGVKCQGNVVISASNIAHLTNQSEIVVGAADKPAGALYNYIKVVPLNWTEVPPVTVAETFTYDQDAFVGPNDTKGTANVKVYKMTDDSYTMEITAPVATKVGVITVGEDAKGRTTYMGEVESSVVSGVKYVVNGVVYEEGGAKHLYMTLTHDDDTYIIGENPDAPKVVSTLPFENVAYTTSMGGNGTATVTFTEMSDATFPMTFVSDDLNVKAENLTKGTDEKGRTTYTGTAKRTDVDVTFTVKAVVYGETTAQKLYMTMDNGSSLVVTVGEDPDYVAPEPEIEGTVVEGSKNYAANGSKFEWSNIAINWNKQKLVAVIDLSSCTGTSENILSVGQNIGSWSIGGWHFYYTVASKKMKSDYLATDGAHPVSDPKTGVEPGTVRIELSKAEGCTIAGVSYNALYDSNVTGTWQSNTEDFWNLTSVNIGSKEGANRSNAVIKYVTVVDLPVTVKEEKTFNEALYMVQGTTSTKVADAKVVVKEMSDNTVNMSLQFNGNEYTSTELVKGTDEKNRTTYTGKVSKDTQTFDVAGVVYEKETADRLYMTMTATGVTFVVGENPDVVTPEVTEVSNKTYTSNLRILDGETTVVEEAEANVNIVKYSDESYKVTLKNVNMLNKTQDLVFVGKALIEEAPTEATEPLTIIAKSDAATTEFFGEEMSATFEITEVSAEEIKMGFVLNNTSLEYQGEFNYTEEETPEVYTSNLHIYDAAAPETDLFQADQAKVEFLATATGEFKLTLKDVTLNEKTQDLVFTGTLPTPQPGGQDPLAEEGETTPAEPAMVLNAIADEATTDFFGGGATYATAVFNVSYDKNDNFMMTFTIAAGKNYAGEFNYVKKTPDTPDPELFCKENYVADGEGFEWEIAVDWDTQKIVMSIDPSTCTGSCEDVIGLGAVPTAWDNTLHLYRTSADQMLQGYFQTSADNNNTGKFAETAPFLVEVSKAQGFVVNNEVKIAASEMSYLFTLPTVKMGTGEGANDKSRATYNYVKVVDKDWTAPKDPDTGINATTVAEGEVEFFTVNGVKLNKLQKGLNIVRTADGKVKKVLVK